MSSKSELKKLFEDLYQLEKQAHDLYGEYLKDLNESEAREVVTDIMNDESEHMEIAEKLIKLTDEN